MKPSDVALLVILGTSDSGPASLDEIVAVVRRLASAAGWPPTPERIRGCVERAILKGLLRPLDDGPTAPRLLEATVKGRRMIEVLLRKPMTAAGGGMHAGIRAKLWFLHYLPLPDRLVQGEQLGHWLREILRLPTAVPGSPAAAVEIAAIESELAWLDGMRRWPAQRLAAE